MDWIERLLGLSPDAGSGVLEAVIALTGAAALVIAVRGLWLVLERGVRVRDRR